MEPNKNIAGDRLSTLMSRLGGHRFRHEFTIHGSTPSCLILSVARMVGISQPRRVYGGKPSDRFYTSYKWPGHMDSYTRTPCQGCPRVSLSDEHALDSQFTSYASMLVNNVYGPKHGTS